MHTIEGVGFYSGDILNMDENIIPLFLRKYKLFNSIAKEINEQYGIDPHTFDLKNIEVIELYKAIIRTCLRYHSQSLGLEINIAKNIDSKLKYCTMPYPIIHLPRDTSEPGPIHTDGQDYVDHFITTWLPLNDCSHRPIKLIDREGSVLFPTPDLGSYLVWDGDIKHEGVINVSEKTHVALVMKFTDMPLLNERVATIKDLFNSNYEKILEDDFEYVNDNINTRELISIFQHINKENNYFNNGSSLSMLESLMKAEYIILSYNIAAPKERLFSHMFTLYAQRMEPHKQVIIFFLYSILFYQDNLLGLQKIIYYSSITEHINNTQLLIDYFLKRYPSRQAVYSINSLNIVPMISDEGMELLNWTK